jgi:serine/threonine protein kinase
MSDRVRSAPPDLPGYTFVRSIGGGGFADVYLYQQLRPSRQVAIKVLRAEHLSESGLRQFETEADVMAGISEHPYIVTVYTANVAPDGRPFIVMEHYPQPHFGLRARGGALPVAEAIRVAVQVSSAVHTAHEAGVLHRDIKPANILTSAFGRPGLTDFGISGVRRDGVIEAAEGVTIPFAPPEVLADSAVPGDERSDVYALAATTYALVAGRPPHWVLGGDNSDAAMVARTATVTPPPTGRPDTGQLERLLQVALSRDPATRPPTALAFAQALQQVELDLRLSPTSIEVRGEVYTAPKPRIEDDDEEDRTRRPVRVVDPEGPEAATARTAAAPTPVRPLPGLPPSPGVPATAPGLPAATGAPLVGAMPGPSTPVPHGIDGDGALTVRRAPAVRAIPEAPAPVAPTETPERTRPPTPLLVAIGAAVLLVVGFIAFSLLGGSAGQQTRTTTTCPSSSTRRPTPPFAGTPRRRPSSSPGPRRRPRTPPRSPTGSSRSTPRRDCSRRMP